jgi:hypothetical protein
MEIKEEIIRDWKFLAITCKWDCQHCYQPSVQYVTIKLSIHLCVFYVFILIYSTETTSYTCLRNIQQLSSLEKLDVERVHRYLR